MRFVRQLFGSRAYRGKHAARLGMSPSMARFAGEEGLRTFAARPRAPVVALLYDAENIPGQNFERALEAARGLGEVRVVRAFGNARLMASTLWTDLALVYGVDRVVCEGFVAGKNSADMRLAVDAMDLLSAGEVDVFALVSDDTDFAPVARRLRQGGKRVFSMGTGRSKAMFRGVYDGFSIISKRGRAGPVALEASDASLDEAIALRARKSGIDRDVLELVVSCALKGAEDDGWCTVGRLSTLMQKERSNFSAKRYGCSSMKKFVTKTGLFELRHEAGANYIRLKAA